MTVAELFNEWLNTYQKDQVKRQTYVRYVAVYNNNIKDLIGDRDIKTLTRRDMQEYINILKTRISKTTHKVLNPKSINMVLNVVNEMFNYAVDFELVEENPCLKVRGCHIIKDNRVRVFTKEEQQKMERYIESLKNPEYFGIILVLYTGLRMGELLALKWDDIDFDNGILSVTKVQIKTKINGEWVYTIDTPKSKTSIREIPLADWVLLRLKAMKDLNWGPYVISKKNGDMFYGGVYRERFDSVQKKCELPHRSFHALRHTFATRAIESGMDVKSLADILGHANAAVTLNVYAHSLMSHKKDMMNNMGRMI